MTTTKENGLFVIRGKFRGVVMFECGLDRREARDNMTASMKRVLNGDRALVPANWAGAL